MEVYVLGVAAGYSAYKLTNDPKYEEKMFFFMEKSKSNILLDRALDLKARYFAGIPEKVLEEERALLGTLSILQKELLSDDREKTQQQYLATQRQYLSFVNDLERRYPTYHHLKYDATTTAVTDVCNSLSPGEALIEYFTTDSVIYIIEVDHSHTAIDTVQWNVELSNSVSRISKSLSVPVAATSSAGADNFHAFIEDSHYIFERLLRPVLANVTATKLIIIPDGRLCYIPFEVLLTAPVVNRTVDYSRLPYLLEDYEIRYAYSASLGLEQTNVSRPRNVSFLGFAPSYKNNLRPGTGPTLLPLANNKREVEQAAELWDGQSFVDSSASEQAFKKHALSANVLHLAAHTIIDDFESSNSGIALLPGASEDGFLHTYELYGMDLNADLAILSGCETGIGLSAGGEGMKSLARAFKFAGCNSIVMSLWNVSDITTMDIMSDFHKNLKAGMEKGEALRQAKLAYIKQSPLANPFYWGAFVLVGDDLPLNASGRNIRVTFIITGCLTFLLLVFLLGRRRTIGTWLRRDRS